MEFNSIGKGRAKEILIQKPGNASDLKKVIGGKKTFESFLLQGGHSVVGPSATTSGPMLKKPATKLWDFNTGTSAYTNL